MIRKLLFVSMVLTAVAVGYGVVASGYIVHNPNRNPYYGYFQNKSDAWGGDVLPVAYDGGTNAIPNSVNTAAEFIAFIESNLSAGPNTQKGVGAAFIIDTMEGGGSKPPSAAAIRQWELDVNYYAAKGWINWSATYNYSINTYYQGTGTGFNYKDDAFFCAVPRTSSNNNCVGQLSDRAITFGHGGVTQYAIRRQCANPIMNSSSTPIDHGPAPGWSIAGYNVPSVATASLGDAVTFTHHLTNNGPSNTQPTVIDWGSTNTVDGSTAIPGHAYGAIAAGADISVQVEAVSVGVADVAAGKICRATFWSPSSSSKGGPTTSAESCITVVVSVATPYLSVIGGDVAAGPGFGVACTSAMASILGANRGASAGFYGSGSQLGAFSLGRITDFATNTTLNSATGTGSSSSGASALQPSGLAFSNNGASATVYGTTFGKDPADDPVDNPSWCVPNYYANALRAIPAPATLSGGIFDQSTVDGPLSSGKPYTYTGTLTIGQSGPLTLGGASPGRIMLVVNGDVIIKNNIIYNGYNYTSGATQISAVPQFQLLVNGNIYVDKGVATLDGFYAAQGSGGTIYTCASGQKYLTGVAGDVSPNAQQDAAYYADCKTQLMVHGSLAARHYKLLRTGGNLQTVGSLSNVPAEQVVYGPELWLGDLGGAIAGSGPYDSITSLPPIL